MDDYDNEGDEGFNVSDDDGYLMDTYYRMFQAEAMGDIEEDEGDEDV